MFQDDMIFSLLSFGVGAYLFYMWCSDCAYFSARGIERKGAFAGAYPTNAKMIFTGVLSAVVLLGTQIAGENSLDFSDKQTTVGMFAVFSWMSAAFVEELVFRGYLIIQKNGLVWLIGSAVFFSLIFALAHPFLWDYKIDDGISWFAGTWIWDFSPKSFYNTLSIFECSLLFYFLRFMPQNKNKSLLPCVAAHFAYNIGVFAAKASAGFVEWTF